MSEEPMRGGRATPGVVRIGDTVRRPRGDRAERSTEVLRALVELGFAWAPTHLGIDEQDRDVLRYIAGTTTDHPSQRDERSYAAIGAILRDLHDRTRGTAIAEDASCLVHGDPGPFNTVMQHGMPVALIDWDTARPGDPLVDVGSAAWSWCVQTLGHVPVPDQAERLRRFRDGYDVDLDPEALLEAIDAQQRSIIEIEGRMRSEGDPVHRGRAAAAVAWASADRQLMAKHRQVFLDALHRARPPQLRGAG